jgi:hypothetical protein
MAVKKSTAPKKLKSTTNYSDAQLRRDFKKVMDRQQWFANAKRKAKASITGAPKKAKPVSSKGTKTKSSAQIRAIYAKKK